MEGSGEKKGWIHCGQLIVVQVVSKGIKNNIFESMTMSNGNTSLDDLVEAEEREFELQMLRREKKHSQKQRMLEGKNLGRWDYQEHLRYYIFLAINEQLFKDQNMSRNNKVFKLMANHIPSRTPQQCRSHHQKIKSKWSDVDLILENLSLEFGGMKMKEILQNYDAFSIKTSSSTIEKTEGSDYKDFAFQAEQTGETIDAGISRSDSEMEEIGELDEGIFNFESNNDPFGNPYLFEDSLFNFM